MVSAGRPYLLIMADVDNFKKYNDNYGHSEGDRVLRGVAGAMSKSLRDQDFIARYGGEEIVVLCENVSPELAVSIADRLRLAVYDLNLPHEFNAAHGRVTVSIGGTLSHTGDQETATEVLVRADRVLYVAKRERGRNAVVVA